MTNVKLELITDIDMLLIIEKGIRGGVCHFALYVKAYNECIKNTIKSNRFFISSVLRWQ